MNKSPITIKGYVTSLPRNMDPRQANVAILQDGVYILLMSALFVLANLATDIACAALDPRLRLGGST